MVSGLDVQSASQKTCREVVEVLDKLEGAEAGLLGEME